MQAAEPVVEAVRLERIRALPPVFWLVEAAVREIALFEPMMRMLRREIKSE
jgi:hypothetical protein